MGKLNNSKKKAFLIQFWMTHNTEIHVKSLTFDMYSCPGGHIHIKNRSKWKTPNDRYKVSKHHQHEVGLFGLLHDQQDVLRFC